MRYGGRSFELTWASSSPLRPFHSPMPIRMSEGRAERTRAARGADVMRAEYQLKPKKSDEPRTLADCSAVNVGSRPPQISRISRG